MNRRPTRSDKYQHLIVESAFSNEMMESFSNDESIYNRLNPFDYNEELLDLEDELKKEFWRIVDNLLTPRQKAVLKLASEGHTQMEIAKKLKVNQSSITKSLNGNVDYKNGKKVYGGSKKKILKIIESDEGIKAILDKMQEIRSAKW